MGYLLWIQASLNTGYQKVAILHDWATIYPSQEHGDACMHGFANHTGYVCACVLENTGLEVCCGGKENLPIHYIVY